MLKINGKVITDVVYKGKRILRIMVGEKKYYDIYDGKIIGNALKADSININGKTYNYGAGYFEINVGELNNSSLSSLFTRKEISTISHFGIDTRRVTDMLLMFYLCSSLTNLNLLGLDTSKVKNMYRMFNQTTSLTTLNLGDKFDTSNVTNMSYMFWLTTLTTLDLGDKFNTSNVTSMYSMFNGCSSLSALDLGDKFDAGKVTNVMEMFKSCPSLKTITGCIKNLSISLNLSSCPLDHDSAVRIINGLATVTTALTLTLNNKTKTTLSDTEKAILINKGWTLA